MQSKDKLDFLPPGSAERSHSKEHGAYYKVSQLRASEFNHEDKNNQQPTPPGDMGDNFLNKRIMYDVGKSVGQVID